MATAKAGERVVRLRLVCEAAPTGMGIEFGLQDKAGRLQPGVHEPDGAVTFEADIRVVRAGDGRIGLRGPIVHGSPAAPFLYLSCRAVGSPAPPWIFRLKVSLAGVDGAASFVKARVRGTGGGSVPLLGGGWTPV